MKDNVYRIIGRIVVAIIVVVLAGPFVLSHVHKEFKPPIGKIYKIEEDKGARGKEKTVVVFSDDGLLKIYSYTESIFSEMSGFRMDYQCSGDSYLRIGPVAISPEPSIMFWKNYSFPNRYVQDNAIIRLRLKDVFVLNGTLQDFEVDRKTISTSELSVNTKSIKIDGVLFDLISENDTTDYEILRFDKSCVKIDDQ